MPSIMGQAAIERNRAKGEITAKPAWDMPLPESTKRTPLSFWNRPTKMPGSSGRPTDEGNTARGRSSPGKPAVQTCLCSCRRRARPHEECEEVRGTLFSSSSSSFSSSSPPARGKDALGSSLSSFVLHPPPPLLYLRDRWQGISCRRP